MPFAFDLPRPPQHTINTPWAVPGVVATEEPHTKQAFQPPGGDVNTRFHHYYKKHMTILGLRKELDSSDTDSENSENFQNKLFRRRRHKLRPVVTQAMREAAALQARKEARPWVQLVAPLDRLGLTPVPDPEEDVRRTVPLRSGKRVNNYDAVNEGLEVPVRHRASPLENYKMNLEAPRCRTSLAGEWDDREVKVQEEKRARKREQLTPPVPRAVSVLEKQKEVAQQRRSQSSLSTYTATRIVDTIKRLKREQRESLARHRVILDKIGATPPLAL